MLINDPLVSVAICTYNGEKFIIEQLESIIKQTYQNIEIIIVDDCSSDCTIEEINKVIKGKENIKLIQNQQNLGFIKNFEKAISLCNGEFICLSDQDDIWDLEKVELLINNIGSNILIYHDSNFIDDSGKKIGSQTMSMRYNMYSGLSALPFILSNCLSGHALMFSKSLLQYILPFDKRFYHDWWIAYVAYNLGTVKYLNKILVNYRQHNDSITDNLNIKSEKTSIETKGRITIDLEWIYKCSQFMKNREPELIKKVYAIFSDFKKRKGRFKLFIFLVSYYDLFFFILKRKEKSLASKINYSRKIAFSKKSPF